ncbi:Uncharacterised protein [Enterobacter hormaechei]|nr:hypothetical protein AI2804V2_4819 [Enterobacter cloacae]CAH5237818.1 hypothetical protein AI2804V2_4819 [Enterobacter cloacae]CZV60967.1 Uncharacterised protein [Enterobacter hormaechei]SAG91247.1 Uncharacterised protein [Enterobacter cloacae]
MRDEDGRTKITVLGNNPMEASADIHRFMVHFVRHSLLQF